MADLIICKNESLVEIADAIRAKANTSVQMGIEQMPSFINGITSGGALTTCNIVIQNNSDDYLMNVFYLASYDGKTVVFSKLNGEIDANSKLSSVVQGSILTFEEYASTFTSNVSWSTGTSVQKSTWSSHKGVHAIYVPQNLCEDGGTVTLTVY